MRALRYRMIKSVIQIREAREIYLIMTTYIHRCSNHRMLMTAAEHEAAAFVGLREI